MIANDERVQYDDVMECKLNELLFQKKWVLHKLFLSWLTTVTNYPMGSSAEDQGSYKTSLDTEVVPKKYKKVVNDDK